MRQLLGRFCRIVPFLEPFALRCDNILRGTNVRRKGWGNTLSLSGARLVRVHIDVNGDNNHVEIGQGSRLFDCVIAVRGSGHRVRIGRDCILTKMHLEVQTEATNVNLGDHTTCGGVVLDISEPGLSISVGQDCMFSFDVEMRCGDSHSIIDRATGARLNPGSDILIGDHVWIGAHSAVLKGSVIGSNSVIGFRSVVTGDIPENSLAVGTPARVFRSGIGWVR